jgi:hypothetical protein
METEPVLEISISSEESLTSRNRYDIEYVTQSIENEEMS